jgi:Transcriptional regulator containing an amidase domain and an AraC-type DNA-binding HTH domain
MQRAKIMQANSGITTIAELQTADFVIAEKRYSSGTVIGKHSHESLVMSFPLAGAFIESNSTTIYTCEKHGLSMNPAGESHANSFSHGPTKCLVVSSVTSESARFIDAPHYIRNIAAAGFALRIHRELLGQDSVSPLMAQGLVLEMLAFAARERLSGRANNPPKWLLNVRDYINANVSEAHDLARLSELAAVHQTTLCRQFRRYYKRSVGDYVRELRIQRSMSELSNSKRAISDIAYSVGFYDQSHFANSFKRYTGMTPAEFRSR